MNRRKRLAVVFAVVLVVSCVLTVTAFAADDGSSSGFSLWNLLDGIGGFFRDLINSIGGFFSNLIQAVKNGVTALLDGLAKIGQAISKAVNALLDGIKWLFVPSKESFFKFRDDILAKYDEKFGSAYSAVNYLKSRFGGLSAKSDLRYIFKISFPASSFLYGVSINLLEFASPFLSFIRVVTTGVCCLVTFLICYHKVVDMVNV